MKRDEHYYQATEQVEKGCGCWLMIASTLIVISIILIIIL